MLRKLNLILLLSLLSISHFLNFPAQNNGDTLLIKKGELYIDNKCFNYEKSDRLLNIFESNGALVFSSTCQEKNTIIMDFGYSQHFNSFYVFKEKITLKPLDFNLILEFENFEISVVEHSPSAFYSPLLVEGSTTYALFVGEDFSLIIYNLETGEQQNRLEFHTPLMDLSKNRLNDKDIIVFKKFDAGTYKKLYFYIEDLGAQRMNCFSYGSTSAGEASKTPKQDGYQVLSDESLDYNKGIGFGDSITYGKINRKLFPELGYVPRLEILLRDQLLPDAQVVNEGVSGSKTVDGLERIHGVISEHKGKYLLFHYGTNDVIHPVNIPLSSITFNIAAIMDIALELELQPVLSTLIPRNGNFGEGIYRLRAEEVTHYIRELSLSMGIPLVDFWQIFSAYPASDGGYDSLMSDGVHPSEKGYQLMANEWARAMLALPPRIPWGIGVSELSKNKVTFQWMENIEKDFSTYNFKFGFSPDTMVRTASMSIPNYTLILFPFQTWAHSSVYISIQSEDLDGHKSEFSLPFKLDLSSLNNNYSEGIPRKVWPRIYQ